MVTCAVSAYCAVRNVYFDRNTNSMPIVLRAGLNWCKWRKMSWKMFECLHCDQNHHQEQSCHINHPTEAFVEKGNQGLYSCLKEICGHHTLCNACVCLNVWMQSVSLSRLLSVSLSLSDKESASTLYVCVCSNAVCISCLLLLSFLPVLEISSRI